MQHIIPKSSRNIGLKVTTNKRVLKTPRVRVKGVIWNFHKLDPDPYPSIPHGHSLDGKYKLELWTGNIINIQTGKKCGKASDKEMKQLYNCPGFADFVDMCRDEYRRIYPQNPIKELTLPRKWAAASRHANTVKQYDNYSVTINCFLYDNE